MSEVGAHRAGSGNKSEPEAAARRRRMTIKLRQARQSLSEPEVIPSHSAAMVRLFAQINRSAAPMLAVVALGVCATALTWIDAGPLVTWISFIACAMAISYALPIAFLDSGDQEKTAGVWRRKFVLATALCGSAWAYLIVALLQSSDPNAEAFAIVVMLLVSTVMSLLAAAIPAAFVAGMAPIIIGAIILYAPRLQGRRCRRRRCRSAPSAISWSSLDACKPPQPATFPFRRKKLPHRRTRTSQAQFGRGAPPR